jgi:elastin
MKHARHRIPLVLVLPAVLLAVPATPAEAVVGRPASPVSYAGVARRSTVGVGAPGVGVTPGVGVGTPGVGVAPGVGAPGVGVMPGPGVAPVNAGGPVNRVGIR